MTETVFDQPDALRFTEARQALLARMLPSLKGRLGLTTALDVGCGVGYFSSFLAGQGFDVVGADARSSNIAEARQRHPGIPFHVVDVEETSIQGLGQHDLVLCLGLIYHLESPLRALRNIGALSAKALVLESMCTPSRQVTMGLYEEGDGVDQSVRRVSFYASEPCIVKMLYRAGFSHVYRFHPLPDHPCFHGTWARRQRTMLLAVRQPLELDGLRLLLEPNNVPDPWTPVWFKMLRPHYWRAFARKPWAEKVRIVHSILGG